MITNQDKIKREVLIINDGELPDRAYVNGTPVFLQASGDYADAEGKEPMQNFYSSQSFVEISLKPESRWKL